MGAEIRIVEGERRREARAIGIHRVRLGVPGRGIDHRSDRTAVVTPVRQVGLSPGFRQLLESLEAAGRSKRLRV